MNVLQGMNFTETVVWHKILEPHHRVYKVKISRNQLNTWSVNLITISNSEEEMERL